MEAAINIITKEKCSGCFGCLNICPVNAITMDIDEEGFYIPNINSNCNNCGFCQKACPTINHLKDNRVSKPISYAGWTINNFQRINSSSGGIFPELANTILALGGSVYGVAWDENFNAKHVKILNNEELQLITGSKYIPSNVGKIYKEVISDLSDNKLVFFSGTPCQISAINNLVKNKENLYTAEVICHGVPSLNVFKKYLGYISKGKEIKSINFRDKCTGWSRFSINIKFNDNSIYSEKFVKDWFYWGFNNNYYLKNICYNCPFAKVPRQADITLGDFWGAPKNIKDEKGVSAIVVNTKKGEELLKKTQNVTLKPVNIKSISYRNIRLIKGNYNKPILREEILTNINHKNFKEVINILKIEKSKKIMKLPMLVLRKIIKIIQNRPI